MDIFDRSTAAMQFPDGDTETVVRDESFLKNAEVSLQVTASRVPSR